MSFRSRAARVSPRRRAVQTDRSVIRCARWSNEKPIHISKGTVSVQRSPTVVFSRDAEQNLGLCAARKDPGNSDRDEQRFPHRTHDASLTSASTQAPHREQIPGARSADTPRWILRIVLL